MFLKSILGVLHLFSKFQNKLANATKMPCRIVLGSAWNLRIDSGRSDHVSHGLSLLIHGEGTSPFHYRFWVLLFGFILSRFRWILFQVSLPDLLNVLAKIVMISDIHLLPFNISRISGCVLPCIHVAHTWSSLFLSLSFPLSAWIIPEACQFLVLQKTNLWIH